MRSVENIMAELSAYFDEPDGAQELVDRMRGDKEPDESTQYRAWLAWLVHSGADELYADFKDWSEKHGSDLGTTANRVYQFYAGFLANEGIPR